MAYNLVRLQLGLSDSVELRLKIQGALLIALLTRSPRPLWLALFWLRCSAPFICNPLDTSVCFVVFLPPFSRCSILAAAAWDGSGSRRRGAHMRARGDAHDI